MSRSTRAILAAWGVILALVVGARWVGGVVNADATVLAVAGTAWQGSSGGGLLSIQSSALFLVDINTGLETRLDLRLASPIPPNYDRLAWSPANRWLAYVASEPDIFPESPGLLLDGLFLLDFETLAARLILQDVARDSDLAWSPDGTRLAVAAHVSGTRPPDIFLVETASGTIRNLTHDPARDVWPQWTADGQAVVFLSNRDGDWELYAITVSDGTIRNLTQHPAEDRAVDGNGSLPAETSAPLAPSPVGSEVAFISNRDSAGDLFAVDVDSGQTRKLAAVNGQIRDLSWSPGGSRLLFSTGLTYAGGLDPHEVYALDVASGALTNVSRQPEAEDIRPLWANSERYVVFNSNREGAAHWAIYLADLESGTLRNLSAASVPAEEGSDLLRDGTHAPVGGWQPFYSSRQAGRLFVLQTRSGEVRGLNISGQIFASWNP